MVPIPNHSRYPRATKAAGHSSKARRSQTMSKRFSKRPFYLLVPCIFIAALAIIFGSGGAIADHTPGGTYVNPLTIDIPNSTFDVETFADPAVIRGNDGFYYAYGTTDPLHDQDRQPNGDLNFHK